MKTYKTIIQGRAVEAIEMPTPHLTGYEKTLRNETFNDRTVLRIYELQNDTAFVFSTSRASRIGDEEPGRDVVAISELKRAGLI